MMLIQSNIIQHQQLLGIVGVTKQTLDYAHRNRCTRIVRRKGGVKEFRITWL